MNVLNGHHKTIFVFMLIALAGMQTSCGFHLRGAISVPDHISPLFLDLSATDDELGRELQTLLSSSNDKTLVASIAEAKTVLKISHVQKKQRVVAIDNLGRAREYELNYQFHYKLTKLSTMDVKPEIIKTNTVKLKRDLLFDPESVLAVSHEKEKLYKDMRKDAARIVLRHLSTIKKSLAQPVLEK